VGRLYDLVIVWVNWDPLGRFQRRYLAALCREHGYLKLIGIRTEGVNPPKLEEVYVSLRMVPPYLPGAAQVAAAPERVMGVGVALQEYRRLVVLGAPGAGKTTLLDYLTLGFAGGLPKEKRQELPQERLLPIFIPLRRCTATEKTLPEALTDPALKLLPPDLLGDCPPGFFRQSLERGRCLVLLDGLDEVASESQYRAVVAKINSLVTTYPQNRYVVTCRNAGWRGWPGSFIALEIQDFRPADVERFVQGWYRAVLSERVWRNFSGTKEGRQAALERARQEAQGEADKLIAILKERERLGWLAANPMMLSLIAFVHYTRRDLPRGRAALYKECVEILLELWDKRDKELHLADAPSLAQKEAVLRQIAYGFQVAVRREAPRTELEATIARMVPGLSRTIGAPEFLRQIEERSGLLVERAIDVLGFSHRVFQEYMTALVFKDDEAKRPELLAHRADPDWREVFLLYSGMLREQSQATDWLQAVWQAEGNPPLLAGRCLAETVQVAPETREKLLAALNTAFRSVHDPALLWETGEVLAEVSGKDVADYFLANLSASEAEVRRTAIRALGQPKQSLPLRVIQSLLTVAQKDVKANVRAAALETLGQLRQRGLDVPQAKEFADVITFLDHAERYTFVSLTGNPYVPGGPLRTDDIFFGRDQLIADIAADLQGMHQDNVIVLYGQRRTGKTSLLYALQRRLPKDRYVPVFYDAEGVDSPLSLFWGLASQIHEACATRGIALPEPTRDDYIAEADAQFEYGFLRQVERALGQCRLLLMIDEFEGLEMAVKIGHLPQTVFPYFRRLMQHQWRLSFIFCGTHQLQELARDYWQIFFNAALARRVTFLDKVATLALIQEPVRGHFTYDELALTRLLDLTGGHPFFTQLLCHSLVALVSKQERGYVTRNEVDEVARQLVRTGHDHLDYIWKESVLAELALLLALTDETKFQQRAEVLWDKVEERLGEQFPDERSVADEARASLERREMVANEGAMIRFTMELIPEWLAAHHTWSSLKERKQL
jgi:predicted ATPase